MLHQVLQAAVPVKQADAVCAKCHAEIFNKYLGTPMANASGSAMDHLIPGDFTSVTSGTKYRIHAEDSAAWLDYDDPQSPPAKGRMRLDYFLGSGHLGITYLYSLDKYLLESPVAYYTSANGYDMKPGFDGLREMPSAIPMEAGCLRCHMSGVRHSDPGSENHYSEEPFLYGGITCESCHGDTKAHVLSAGKMAVLNPAKLDADRRDSICMSCHLEGDVSVEKKGRSVVDFKPGEPISRYLSYFVYASAGATARGVSEVEQFDTSMCKRASGSKMSCTNCHDPHYTPLAAERAAFYRGKCLACHNQAAFVKEHHPENLDCTSCHMPRSKAQNIPHVAWTDHRILRQPKMDLADVNPAHPDNLVPIFSPSATPRDTALAYYAAAMEGHTDDRERAYTMLTAAHQNDPDDVQVLRSLGLLAGMSGDTQLAGSLFRNVLKLSPTDQTAASDLAVLEAKTGDLQGALGLLQPVFNRNQDSLGLAMNLAAVECLLGDGTAARSTIETALKYNPGSRELTNRLKQTSSCAVARPK
ncbi:MULTISPECIES: tetratricopeptide repeat protein [Acidobacteriaceae]|uniref:tetratricopeptide repeat protein n=1 Tax=Acidobacteriaceae TaxID=204434 RepID=UPI00131BEE0A|nr:MULTISPECIES: multiheme c-type cytochrome [Acidobacteriaceae]